MKKNDDDGSSIVELPLKGTPVTDWPNRWNYLRKILQRRGSLATAGFEPSADIVNFLLSKFRILVIGAGGLGCELLKNLAFMGFRHIDVIDMDTIDVSNLNRQFLFRSSDVGRYKAEVAAEFINQRIIGSVVIPHNCRIQDYDVSFYRKFHVVVCGLDSIVARRWINGLILSILEYDEDGTLDPSTVIPIIDGGTEGFKGNARVIYPGMSACIECTLDLFPPVVNYPLCTIAHTPRLPEHCVEYVQLFLWPKENPFGVSLDFDDPVHILWIFERSLERAAEFNIIGVTHRLTQGVVKRIMPAVSSTNAVIAAVCATEVFKVATSSRPPLNNYLLFNDVDGIYTYSYEAAKNENCIACSQKAHKIVLKSSDKLKDLISVLKENPGFRMKSPGITTTGENGNNRTLYMEGVSSIEEITRSNLNKSLDQLNLKDGCEIIVADVTSPNAIVFRLSITQSSS